MKTIVQGGDAVKTFARRDSATAELRKLGIKPSDYNMFINQTTDGRVSVALERAKEYLQARLRHVAQEVVPQQQNKGRTSKEAESNQIKRPTASSVIRKLILDGLDNKQIHEKMKQDFGHDEDKAHYPSWYRSQMRREGLVPKEKAVRQPKASKKAAKKTAKKAAKVVTKKARRERRGMRKQVKAAPKKAASSQAKSNIAQTKRASVKTGNRVPTPGPLSIIQVH